MGAELAVTLLISLLNRATQIGALLSKAQATGVDITVEQLDALAQEDDAMRKALLDWAAGK